MENGSLLLQVYRYAMAASHGTLDLECIPYQRMRRQESIVILLVGHLLGKAGVSAKGTNGISHSRL